MSAVEAVTLTTVRRWIPYLPPEEMDERLTRIRPLVERSGCKYFVEVKDPHKDDFLFNQKGVELAILISPAGDITTYHRIRDSDVFRPTVVEVLAAIPAFLVDVVVGFKLLEPRDTDLNSETVKQAYAEGYLAATFRLYKNK